MKVAVVASFDITPLITTPLMFFCEINDSIVNVGELIVEVESAYPDLIEEDKKNQRWPNDFPQVDFKEAIKNLEKYIRLYCEKDRIIL